MFIPICQITLAISFISISFNFYITNKKLNKLNKILNKRLYNTNKKNKNLKFLKDNDYLNNMLNDSDYIIL